MTTLTPEEHRARREARRTWYGYLADDNVSHIAQRIENLLKGRRFTFVSTNTVHTHSVPDVRTGQRLAPEKSRNKDTGVSVYRLGEPMAHDSAGKPWESAGLTVVDDNYVWGMSTHHATEADAYEDAEDPAKRHHATYVVIEGGLSNDDDDLGRRDRIEVTFYNAMSPPEKLQWVIAVEPPIRDDE